MSPGDPPVFYEQGGHFLFQFRTRRRVPMAWMDDVRIWCRDAIGPRSENGWEVDRSSADGPGSMVIIYVRIRDDDHALEFKLRWC